MKQGIKSNTYLCSQIISLTIAEPEGNLRVVSGNLEEIGMNRLIVLVDMPVAEDAQVIVNTQETALRGKAVQWEFVPMLGYYLEVSLSTDSYWSREVFEPEHLLELPVEVSAMAA